MQLELGTVIAAVEPALHPEFVFILILIWSDSSSRITLSNPIEPSAVLLPWKRGETKLRVVGDSCCTIAILRRPFDGVTPAI